MDTQNPTSGSKSLIRIRCAENADPAQNRLELRTDPPTYIYLQPGLNILPVELYPGLCYGFSPAPDEYGELGIEDNCADIQEFDFSDFDASHISTMDHMFGWMKRVQRITFGKMATPMLENTVGAFYRTGEGEATKMGMLDLSGMDFSKVTDAYMMFYSIKTAGINLTGADFMKLSNAEYIFEDCEIDHLILDNAKFPSMLLNQIFKGLVDCAEIKKVSLNGWRKEDIKMVIDTIENQFIQSRHHTSGIIFEFDTDLEYSTLQTKNWFNDEPAPPVYKNKFLGSSRQFYHPTFAYTQKYPMFDGTILEWLNGSDKNNLPMIPIGSLMYQLGVIQRNLYNEAVLKESDENQIKPILWVDEVLPRIQVFLVTTQSEGQCNRGVRPLFGQYDNPIKELIPIQSKNIEDETSPERLGCYVPTYGTIYLWVDRIAELENPPLVFQKVLLHELIHLFLDVIRKSIGNKCDSSSQASMGKEETLDNYLVLYCYAHCTASSSHLKNTYMQAIREIISHQPNDYRKALGWFDNDSQWVHVREKIFNFLNHTN